MAMSVRKGPGGRKTLAEINITPFTDVCLVLLIIFMISASFMGGERGLDVKLPTPSTDTQQDTRPARDVMVMLDTRDVVTLKMTGGPEGSVTKRLTFDELVPDLSAEATKYKIKSVTVKPYRGVVYSKVIRVMDGIKQSGISDMSLTAQEQASAPVPPGYPSS